MPVYLDDTTPLTAWSLRQAMEYRGLHTWKDLTTEQASAIAERLYSHTRRTEDLLSQVHANIAHDIAQIITGQMPATATQLSRTSRDPRLPRRYHIHLRAILVPSRNPHR